MVQYVEGSKSILRILASTRFGGSGKDKATALTIGKNGEITLAGDTTSEDLTITPGAFDTARHGAEDACIAKFDSGYASPIAIASNATLRFFATDLAGNAEAVKSQAYIIDTTAPTGTVTINGGAGYTKNAAATLTLACTDDSGSCTQMRFSNNSTWSTEEPFAPTKAWTLTSTVGTKTVYAKFGDSVGRWSAVTTDTIILETTSPTTTASPAGGIYAGSQAVTLAGSDGTGSGCDKIYYTTDGSTPNASSSAYSAPIAIASSATLYYFATDTVGNSAAVACLLLKHDRQTEGL